MQLLLTDSRVNLLTKQHALHYHASKYGRCDVVQLLLDDPCVDPSAEHNEAVKVASYNEHYTVVQLLMADPRVDPSASGNLAVKFASINGSVSIVELLLADPRVVAKGGEQLALQNASKCGKLNVLRMLLDRPGVVVTKEALIAADTGYVKTDCESVINLFIAEQPLVVSRLCSDGSIVCKRDGALRTALDRWEASSAMTLLLSVKRTQSPTVAGRVADVLREVLAEFTKFRVAHPDDDDE